MTGTYNIRKNKDNKLCIKLKRIDNIIDMSYMFEGCSSLSSLTYISNLETNNVTNMSYMFKGCSSLSSLPNISKWNTNNAKEMIGMFEGC